MNPIDMSYCEYPRTLAATLAPTTTYVFEALHYFPTTLRGVLGSEGWRRRRPHTNNLAEDLAHLAD
jgi:hypothetical protein